MGIETEYGVLQPGRPTANPMLLSSHVVAVHAAARQGGRAKARWDYDDEDPLQDARGFHLQRASAHPSLLTDDPSRPAPSGPVGTGGGTPASAQVASAAGTPGASARGRSAGRAARQQPEEVERPSVEDYDDPSAAN